MSTFLIPDPHVQAQAIHRPGFPGPQYILAIRGRPTTRGMSPIFDRDALLAARALLDDSDSWTAAQGTVWGRLGSTWHPLTPANYGPPELLEALAVAVVVPSVECFETIRTAPVRASDDDATLQQWLRGVLAGIPGAQLLDTLPKDFAARAVCAPGAPPELDGGFLGHPLAGIPVKRWVERAPNPLPTPDLSFPHWRTLFSGLNLPSYSLYPLVAYCLACHHAVSLDYERFILVVDSWARARGKTEVCSVLGTLLDNTSGTINWPPGAGAANDTVVAHLASGHRVLTVNNLHGRAGWHNETFASAATDGALHVRAKYSAQTAAYDGIVVAASLVYGAASLDPDLLSRCLRVELPGAPGPLNPRPRDYARAHRLELLAEALAALPDEIPARTAAITRAAEFEAVGVAAASSVLGVRPDTIRAEIARAYDRQAALTPEGVQSLYAAHPEAFDAPVPAVVGAGFGQRPAPPPDGAAALGWRCVGGEWRAEP